MVFSSLEFIFIFLPLFYLTYIVAPKKTKNLVLFVASLAFYAVGVLDNPFYLPLFVFSLAVNFMVGWLVQKKLKHARLHLIVGVVYNMTMLFAFKYSSFFAGMISPESAEKLGFVLPVGISFYTFQCVSCLIDVYRGARVETSFINLGAYIAMFPQLIAGPIVRYGDVADRLRKRFVDKKKVWEGISLFVYGLGFKVLLANRLGSLWHDLNSAGFDAITTPAAWLGIIAFSLQIYFDFWGYSLMAIGLGKTLGFDFPRNFDYPYTALTMTEFWRRWHMTLGTWFREYVYIPLGGNRKGSARTYLNLFAVWFLTGFWHGASWNFVLWGLLLFALIALEKAGLASLLTRIKPVGRLYMFIAILLSWLLFATEDIPSLTQYLLCMLGQGGEYAFEGDYIRHLTDYGVFLAVGLLLSTSLPRVIYDKIKDRKLISVPILVAIFLASFYCMYMGMNDPFMYFRF